MFEGVINAPVKSLGLCSSMTGAKFVSTTEVYPDSPEAGLGVQGFSMVFVRPLIARDLVRVRVGVFRGT